MNKRISVPKFYLPLVAAISLFSLFIHLPDLGLASGLAEKVVIYQTQVAQVQTGSVEPEGAASDEDERIEKILQEHAARLELLESNLRALAPRLVNTPTLEELRLSLQNNFEAIQSLGQAVEEHGAALAFLSSSLSALDVRIQSLEPLLGQVAALEAARQALNQKDADLGGKIENLGTSIAQTDRRVVSLETSVAQLPIEQLSDQIAGLQKEDIEAMDAIAAQAEQVKNFQLAVEHSAAADDQRFEQHAASIAELSARADSLGARVDGLPISSLDARISQLESAVTAIPAQQTALVSLGESLKNSTGLLQSQIDALRGDLGSLPIVQHAAQIGELSSALDQLSSVTEGQLAELSTGLQDLERESGDQTGLIRDLYEKLTASATRITAVEEALSGLKQSNSLQFQSLQDQIGAAQSEIRSLSSESNEQIEANAGQSMQISELDHELTELSTLAQDLSQRLESQRVAADQQTTRQSARLERVASDLSTEMHKHVQALQADLNTANQRIEQLAEAIRTIPSPEGDLRSLRAEDQKLQRELELMSQALGRLEDRLAGLNAIFSDLNDKTRRNLVDVVGTNFEKLDREIENLHRYVFYLGGGLVISLLAVVYLIIQK